MEEQSLAAVPGLPPECSKGWLREAEEVLQ